jgi:putative ABC transport system permease protein
VPSVKKNSLDETSQLYLYQPFVQRPINAMYVVIRTERESEPMISAMRSQVLSLDPEIPLFDVHTMEQALAGTVSTKRLTNTLLTGFAITALLLASLGIYGVMSLNVGSRTNEFGIRMALGAEPRALLASVIRQGMTLTGFGVVIGLGGAFVLTRFLESLLFHVKTSDPVIYAGVAVLLSVMAAIACYIPARRATKVDPMVALRYE